MATSKMLSPDELDKLAIIDPEIEAEIKKNPMFSGPKEIPDPVAYVHKARAAYSMMAPQTLDPAVVHEESTYQTKDRTTLPLHIYKPSTPPSTPSPLLIWYHGGGLCVGSPQMNLSLYIHLIKTHNMTIIAPVYRLAPEHKYPTQFTDAVDALTHILTTLLPTPSPLSLLIGGESAGAMLTSLVALSIRDNPPTPITPKITGLYLSSGSYLSPTSIPSQYQSYYRSRDDPRCRSSPFLSWESKQAFDTCAAPDYASPLYRAGLWPTGFKALPRTYFQACGMDILRDDTLIFRDMLEKEGVECKGDVYQGAPHCFWFGGWDERKVGLQRAWREDMEKGWEWLLERRSG